MSDLYWVAVAYVFVWSVFHFWWALALRKRYSHDYRESRLLEQHRERTLRSSVEEIESIRIYLDQMIETSKQIREAQISAINLYETIEARYQQLIEADLAQSNQDELSS